MKLALLLSDAVYDLGFGRFGVSTRPCELNARCAFERCCVRFKAWVPWFGACGHVNVEPAFLLSDAVYDLRVGRFGLGFQAMGA